MSKKILSAIMIVLMLFMVTGSVYADHCTDCASKNGGRCGLCGYDCSTVNGVCVDTGANRTQGTTQSGSSADWWGGASNWGSGMASSAIANKNNNILSGVVSVIKAVGNIVFVTVTVLLGVKYIWGGVDSKASVKDSLVTLVIAALVFYGWDTLSALFSPDKFLAGSAEATATKIASTILYVCNFLAVGGVVYVGMKYMMAGADGKAQLKAQSVPMILGIIMVFATVTFLNLIVGLI